MVKRVLATSFAVLFASSAMAHEGHGVQGQGNTVAHYVLDPMHLPLLILASLAAVGIAALSRKYIANKLERATNV